MPHDNTTFDQTIVKSSTDDLLSTVRCYFSEKENEEENDSSTAEIANISQNPSPAIEPQTTTPKKSNCASKENLVNHDYNDLACDVLPPGETYSLKFYMDLLEKTTKKGEFPLKLMALLHDSHAHSYEDIVSWQPHGRAFRVHQARQFEQHILPQYFKTAQMNSFRKQLSLWGFKRLTVGLDNGAYYHQSFLRGLPHLITKMSCQKLKGTGKARNPNPDEEPDFYRTDGFFKKLPDVSQSLKSPTWINFKRPEISRNVHRNNYEQHTPSRKPYGLAAAYENDFDYGATYSPSETFVHNELYPQQVVQNQQKSSMRNSVIPASLMMSSTLPLDDPYVTEDEDNSIISPDEINSIYSQMSFPPPFTPPPFVTEPLRIIQKNYHSRLSPSSSMPMHCSATYPLSV